MSTAASTTCTVCQHPERVSIDRELCDSGTANTRVAAAHGLSKDAVRRHRENHLAPALKAVVTRRERAGAVAAVDRLEDLYMRASRLLDGAEESGNGGMSLAAVKQLQTLVMDIARLTGEYDDKPVVNVLNVATDPSWVMIRSQMMEALVPYPDAARAVAERLSGVS